MSWIDLNVVRSAGSNPFASHCATARGGSPNSFPRQPIGPAQRAPSIPAYLQWIILGLMIAGSGCKPPPHDLFQGYIEAEYVYVASPLAGNLQSLAVTRGESVTAGAPLYTLDQEAELANQQEAEQRLARARADLDNLKKGKRPSEIAALEAQLQQARDTMHLAETELARRVDLVKKQVIAPEEFERAQTDRDLAQARIDQLAADLETARLGARPDEIRAAEAEVGALAAMLDRARWAVDQKRVSAPTNGLVHDTLYRPAEWVAAGNPVVVLLPPTNLKVRFFVPEDRLPGLQPGQTISVHADGASEPYRATISYLSTQAEFTPPVIYSRDTRSKLIYLVEAVFPSEVGDQLRPGQPVDVRLEP